MEEQEKAIEEMLIRDAIAQTLVKNHKLNFVQRIMSPQNYPTIPSGDGRVSTHKMAWGEADGKYFVYPTIVQMQQGELKELDPDEAREYALKTGEKIEFATPEDADWFSKNYKLIWPQQEKSHAKYDEKELP